jgi:hypothetical protein
LKFKKVEFQDTDDENSQQFELILPREKRQVEEEKAKMETVLNSKDESFISDKNYKNFRNRCMLQNHLPSCYKIVTLRKKLQIDLLSNDYGFFVKVETDLNLYCQK